MTSSTPNYRVLARAAEDLVLEAVTLVSGDIDAVVAGASQHRVVAVSGEHFVSAAITSELIRTADTEDLVAATTDPL